MGFAHILYGSKGPIVDSLVSAYGFPEYGTFRCHGYPSIKKLVSDICATESNLTMLKGKFRVEAQPVSQT